MGYLDSALNVAGAFSRGYGATRRPRPQDQNGGLLGTGMGMGQPPARPQGQQQGGQSVLGMGLNYLRGRQQQPGPAVAATHPLAPPPTMGPWAAPVPSQSAPPQGGPLPDGIGAGPPPAPMMPPIPPDDSAPEPNMPNPDPTLDEQPMAASTDGLKFAQGGVVTRPTTAILGEDGPEMVVPLTGRTNNKVSMANLPTNSGRHMYGRGLGMNYGRR